MDGPVRYEVTDGVAVVTIDRPERRNAMSLEVFDGLTEAAARAAADPEVGAVLVRGAGGHFSSGLDTGLFATWAAGSAPGEDPAVLIARLQRALTAFEELDVPTLAAIEGYCLGGGLQLALACHLRAVAPSAQLGLLEVRWGIIPDLGASYRLPRLVGLGRATELALTGRVVDAEEALRIGLAELALDDPAEQALRFARELAAGPTAVRVIPRLFRENLGVPREQALRRDLEVQLSVMATGDMVEAVRARAEGRPPRYQPLHPAS